MMRLSEHFEGVALVETATNEAAKALASILARYGRVERAMLTDWEAVKSFLLPLKSFPTRYALISFSGWTAIVADMHLEMCHVDALGISKHTGSRAVSAYFRERTRHFHLIEDGRSIRDVTCYEDNGKWVFFQAGQAASFEDLKAYSERKVSDRLTPDAVLAYLHAVTGIAVPLDWRHASAKSVGLERSTQDLKVPIRTWPAQIDL